MSRSLFLKQQNFAACFRQSHRNHGSRRTAADD
jgi:hypothetical protein